MSAGRRSESSYSGGSRIARSLQRLPRLVTLPLGAILGLVLGMWIFDRIIMPSVVRHGEDVRIPSVAGRPVAEARRALAKAGLDPQLTEGRFHPGVPAGAVLEVSPPVGLSVKKGRQVLITPSLGESQAAVPDLLGHTLRMARLLAGDAGLRIGTVAYAATDLARPDQILAMSPEPGSTAAPGGEITLLLGRRRAPAPAWMPDVTGQPGWRVASVLRRSGYRATLEELPGGQPGAIVRQDPAPGAPLWPGTRVVLSVSPGRSSRYGGGIG